MANKFLGEISAQSVDGRDWMLRMDMNAMCEFEDVTGQSAIEAFQQAEQGKAGISMMRQVVFAAMRRHHPEATIQDAGDILSADPQVVQALMAATAPDVKPGKRRAGATKAA